MPRRQCHCPGQRLAVPDYPADAIAVLPLLEKYQYVDAAYSMTSDWTVAVFVKHPDERPFVGKAPTFARAACEALLKAHGKWRE